LKHLCYNGGMYNVNVINLKRTGYLRGVCGQSRSLRAISVQIPGRQRHKAVIGGLRVPVTLRHVAVTQRRMVVTQRRMVVTLRHVVVTLRRMVVTQWHVTVTLRRMVVTLQHVTVIPERVLILAFLFCTLYKYTNIIKMEKKNERFSKKNY
jgi:hypothetical protein